MTKKLILGLLCLTMMHSYAFSQQIKAMKVAEFEELIEEENDTLYVYNFWATWCGPCVAELPHFEKLSEQFQNQKVKVILVSLDFPNGWEERLTNFLTERDIKSQVFYLSNALRPMDWISRIDEKWSGALPATMLRMPARGIKEFREQEFTFEELESWVSSIWNG